MNLTQLILICVIVPIFIATLLILLLVPMFNAKMVLADFTDFGTGIGDAKFTNEAWIIASILSHGDNDVYEIDHLNVEGKFVTVSIKKDKKISSFEQSVTLKKNLVGSKYTF